MHELDLAIKYLKKRAISTAKNKKMRHLLAVNPASEVQEVLEMVRKGTFASWHAGMKEQHGDTFL